MTSPTRITISVIIITLVLLQGCSGGTDTRSDAQPSPATESQQHTTPTQINTTQTDTTQTDSDSSSNTETTGTTESQVSIALRTGNALAVDNVDDLINATLDQIDTDSRRYNSAIRQLFSLQSDGTLNDSSLTSISWNPTHDAATLIPTFGENASVLFTNDVTDTSKTIYEKSIAVIGETRGRYMAMGSNPMRNSRRNPDSVNEQMHSFLFNSINWLTRREANDNSALNVVIAHMDDSYYFPDESGTREWLDARLNMPVSYNAQDLCDDSNLNSCLSADTDLLIISQVLNDNSSADTIAESVRNAMANNIAVLYLHHDGGITDLGKALFFEMNIKYEWDNYWKKLQLTNYDASNHIGKTPQEITAIKTLFNHLLARDYQFNWSACSGESCDFVTGLYSKFEEGALAVRSLMQNLDNTNRQIFSADGHTMIKLLALTGDHIRQRVVFPMDKNTTDDNTFLRSYFADHAVYNSRDINPVQPDMGNFSRSDFDHITPVSKSITVNSKQPFRSAGVYALPGQTVTVTRSDQSDVEVKVFVNTQRAGSTHQWAENGYKRPKFLQSARMPVVQGDTISFTNPYGGPIQISFDANDMPVSLNFQNVGTHPHWSSSTDDNAFAQQLIDGHYDWAELVTPGFEVHSTLDNMNASVNDAKWGSAAALASSTMNYLNNFPHVLAGFQGPGIDVVAEIHEFAERKGFTINNIDKVKHMNADQATCGYGCSGNPYDAYWSYDPLGHGDLHELGHGLEKTRLRFEGWPGHASTNHYSYYTKSRFYQATGSDPECQSLPFDDMFAVLQASVANTDPHAYVQQNLWDSMGWSEGAAMIVQMMMAAQDHAALSDGWHLLPRLHIIEREYSRALNSDEQWTTMQSKLGMSRYTRAEAKSISRNDWLLIALSTATDLDWRNYLNTWAIPYSDMAATQVAETGFSPVALEFYVSSDNGYCKGEGFDGNKLALDGASIWP